jgi:hypothetical protein
MQAFTDDFNSGDSSKWAGGSTYLDGKIPLAKRGDGELRCQSCGATWPIPEDGIVLVPFDHDCPGRLT